MPLEMSSSQNCMKWPLRIRHEVLVVFTRICLKQFTVEGKKANAYASYALTSFLTSLKEAAVHDYVPCEFLKI